MARHPIPAPLVSIDSHEHDRGRYLDRENQPIPSGPLGEPPERLTKAQRAAWLELVAQVPVGVLTVADRIIVEITARLLARMHAGESLKAAETNQIISCLARMGLTPADRSRLNAKQQPSDDPENPFARIAAKRHNSAIL